MSDEAVYFPVRLGRVLFMVFCLVPAFLAGAVGAIVFGSSVSSLTHVAVLLCGILVAPVMAWSWAWWIIVLHRIRRGDRPGLRLDRDGFDDTLTAGNTGTVRWSQVRTWDVNVANRQPYLYVWMTEDPIQDDPAGPLLSRRERWERRLFGRRRAGLVMIPLRNFAGAQDEIVAAFSRASGRHEEPAQAPAKQEILRAPGPFDARPASRPPRTRHRWYWAAAVAAMFALTAVFSDDVAHLWLSAGSEAWWSLTPMAVPAILLFDLVRQLFSPDESPVARVTITSDEPFTSERTIGRLTVAVANEFAESLSARGVDAVARYDPWGLARWVSLRVLGATLLVAGLFPALEQRGLAWLVLAAVGIVMLGLADAPRDLGRELSERPVT